MTRWGGDGHSPVSLVTPTGPLLSLTTTLLLFPFLRRPLPSLHEPPPHPIHMSNITERKNFKVLIGGAVLLSINAGYIGALSLAGLHSATISHITGNIARTGVYLAEAQYYNFARIFLVYIFFIVGSAISTVIVSGTKQFNLRRTYGWALLLESLLLLISYLVSNRTAAKTGWWWSEYFGAMACGVQNALCTSYSGAMIRTTHMTGCVTDIGIALGQEFRIRFYKPWRVKLYAWWQYRTKRYISAPGEIGMATTAVIGQGSEGQIPQTPMSPTADPDELEPSILWRLKVLVPLFLGYLLGAYIGAMVYLHIGNKALLVPSLFIGIVGFFYALSTTFLKTYEQVKSVMPPVDLNAIPLTTMTTMNKIFHPMAPTHGSQPTVNGLITVKSASTLGPPGALVTGLPSVTTRTATQMTPLTTTQTTTQTTPTTTTTSQAAIPGTGFRMEPL